jgi:formate dehydrogenase iron-sulfur subunit
MYVLHHADKPSLYNGLPDDPSISPWSPVEGRGQASGHGRTGRSRNGQPVPLHHQGPNDVSKELEDEMERKDAEALNKENGK